MERPRKDPGNNESGTTETAPKPPTVTEEQDLVRLMRAGREEKTFYLPTGKDSVSDTYFVRARQWTGIEREEYNAVGSTLSMPFDRSIETGDEIGARQDTPSLSRMEVTPDPAQRLRKLIELTVVGYRLAPEGREVNKPNLGEFTRNDWRMFAALPPAVLDWVKEQLHDFLGIEVISPESGGGEAPAPGS